MRRGSAALTAGLFMIGTTLSITVPAVAAQAAPKPKAYKNCTALHKVYPHGVAKKGAKDKVKGKSKPVTNFAVSTATYNLNKKSDGDKDGVACEKH
jgi:Excalibur calcium-binding domain